MGQPGRPSQPTEKKLQKGENRTERLNTDKVKYKSPERVPPPPTSLGALGKTEWKNRASDLMGAGLLQKADEPTLKRWCEAVEMAEKAYQYMKDEGEVIVNNERGTKYLNPWHNVYTTSWRTMKEVSAKFGFTPVDREALKPDEQNKNNGGPSFSKK